MLDSRVIHKDVKSTSYKEFKEFNKKDKDKIAEIVETKYTTHVLSPIVEDYVYGSSRCLDYGDIFGTIQKEALWEHAVNKNVDYFDTTIIHEEHPSIKLPRYMTFRTAGMYLDHNSKSAENSIGFVFDAYDVQDKYDDMHITLLFGIDKKKAPNISRDLQRHPTRVATSMGCSITDSLCTVCGERDCDHLKFMRGGRVGGVKVAELLLGVEFFEDSIVSVPACTTAYVLDAVSQIVPGRLLKVASETDSGIITSQIMTSIYSSIKEAKTGVEKNRLQDQLDFFIKKLDSLSEN